MEVVARTRCAFRRSSCDGYLIHRHVTLATEMASLRRLGVVRYVEALREGGSLPGLVEAEGGELFVLKLRGAGQGARALVAEVIGAEVGRALGLAVPELVVLELSRELGRNERDQEIRELLRASEGLNVGLGYLSRALTFDPAAALPVDGSVASRIVVLDAFLMNVDRTARNPNLLWSEGILYLIDHGAALYWHHDWDGGLQGSDRPFALVRDHVLLPFADTLLDAGLHLQRVLDDDTLGAVMDLIPDAWLGPSPIGETPAEQRRAYAAYLGARRTAAARFLDEAIRARASL